MKRFVERMLAPVSPYLRVGLSISVGCSASSAQTYFSKNPTPFVMGPSNELWLIDNHHGT